MASSLQTLERRIAALEARLADVEGSYGDTLYKLRRESIANRSDVGKIMQYLAATAAGQDASVARELLQQTTEEDVDIALEAEG